LPLKLKPRASFELTSPRKGPILRFAVEDEFREGLNVKGIVLSGLIALFLLSPFCRSAMAQERPSPQERPPGREQPRGAEAAEEEKSWTDWFFGRTQIIYMLYLGAVLILGAVVLPRLAGWIFHPKSQSFIIVLVVLILIVALIFRETVVVMIEEKSPFFIGGTILFVCFIALVFMAKEKKKED
jgi:Na+/melibiose symporter-like transporter